MHTIQANKVEALQRILIKEQQREVSYNEALEIGEAMLGFFELLAADEEDA